MNWSRIGTIGLYGIIVFGTIIIILIPVFLGYIDIAFTLILLLAFWLSAVLIKSLAEFDDDIIFADLSYSAIVFTGSRGITFINNSSNLAPQIEQLIFTLISFCLFIFLYLLNLRVCIILKTDMPKTQGGKIFRYVFKGFSGIIALIPIMIIITLQYWGKLL